MPIRTSRKLAAGPGEDPEEWWHEAGDQQPWKLAARPSLVPRFRHRVPRAL